MGISGRVEVIPREVERGRWGQVESRDTWVEMRQVERERGSWVDVELGEGRRRRTGGGRGREEGGGGRCGQVKGGGGDKWR